MFEFGLVLLPVAVVVVVTDCNCILAPFLLMQVLSFTLVGGLLFGTMAGFLLYEGLHLASDGTFFYDFDDGVYKQRWFVELLYMICTMGPTVAFLAVYPPRLQPLASQLAKSSGEQRNLIPPHTKNRLPCVLPISCDPCAVS